MTVKQLIDKLSQFPDDMSVDIEGCDCIGSAGNAIEYMANHYWDEPRFSDAVLITRGEEQNVT